RTPTSKPMMSCRSAGRPGQPARGEALRPGASLADTVRLLAAASGPDLTDPVEDLHDNPATGPPASLAAVEPLLLAAPQAARLYGGLREGLRPCSRGSRREPPTPAPSASPPRRRPGRSAAVPGRARAAAPRPRLYRRRVPCRSPRLDLPGA